MISQWIFLMQGWALFLRTSSFVPLLWTISTILPNGVVASAADLRPEEIVTVLPKDAIPAILSPTFDQGSKVSWLKGKDALVGVEFSGDSRAYPVATLSRHEIVNDRLGGVPIAVSW